MRLLVAQPRAFYLIFLLEIWERFGYYAITAIFVLFVVQSLGLSDHKADLLFASFTALAYLLPVLGGYIADRFLGTKRTIVFGLMVLLIGYFLLALPSVTHFSLPLPLAIISIGTGLFKPNPSSLLAKVYEGSNYNRDSGYTLFYMAINIGSLAAMILTPFLAAHYNWHVAFFSAAVGLLLANLSYLIFRKTVKTQGSVPDFSPIPKKIIVLTGLIFLLSLGACWALLLFHEVMSFLLAAGIICFFAYFIYETIKASQKEKKGMILFLILFFEAIVFFIIYFQMPMSMTLLALRNVKHSLLGITVHPAQYQALNPFWIFVMSPVLAVVYHKLAMRKKDPSIVTKFVLGIFLAGVAMLTLSLGMQFANAGIISGWWLVISYGFESTGELLVSALGLSLVARYIPQRLMGYTMGLWFLCISIASLIGGQIAALANIPKNIEHDPLASLAIYNHFFFMVGIITVGISIVLFAFVPWLKKLA